MSTFPDPDDPLERSDRDEPIRFSRREIRKPGAAFQWTRTDAARNPHRATVARIGILVIVLMMVIYAMTVTGKPESWNWLFGLSETENAGPQGNHLRTPDGAAAGSTESKSFQSPAATPESMPDENVVEDEAGAEEKVVRPRAITFPDKIAGEDFEEEFLRQFLASLDPVETVTFWQALQHAETVRELPAGATSIASSVLGDLSSQWTLWNEAWDRSAARRDVAPEQRKQVDAIRHRWETGVLPALGAVTVRPDPDVNRSMMADFRQTVRRAADSLIEHFGPVGRPVEAYAWFSAWESVFDQPMNPSIDGFSSPGITELLGQPRAWTGRQLGIRGTARRAQTIRAGHNPLGISEYTIMWVEPQQPSMYPFCIYILEPPAALKGEPGTGIRPVDLPVEVAGTFFKVRLFDGAGRRGEAPVILASTAQPVLPANSARSTAEEVPSARSLIGVVIPIALVAAAIAWFAWRTSLSGKNRAAPSPARLSAAMESLRDNEEIETVQERLQRLEARERENHAD